MSKVYIVQDNPYSPKNFITASDYGELVSCIRGHVSISSLDKCSDELDKALENIEAQDWLILTGHPALIGYACHVMAERTGVINMLVWDNQTNRYYSFSREAQ